MRAKLGKILVSTLLTLLLLLTLSFILVRSRPVQNYLVDEVTKILEKELGTKVSISSVEIEFFKTLVLDDVYIEDQYGDTLFFIKKLKGDFSHYDKDKHRVILDYLKLQGAYVNFVRYPDAPEFNYQFFLDYFQPKDTVKRANPVYWTIGFNTLVLENTVFNMEDQNEPFGPKGVFDPSHFRFSEINGNFSRFRIIDDSLNFRINQLSTVETSGVRINKMKADAVVSSTELSFRQLDMYTDYSRVRNEIVFTYASWRSMNNFIDDVALKGNMVRSEVDARDIAYFAEELKGYTQKVVLNGSVSGRISNLKAKDFYVEYANRTYARGDFVFKGLPDINTTFIDLKLTDLQSNKAELEALIGDSLPVNLASLGRIKFKGKFTGFINDFVAYGNLNSDIGSLSSDLNLKLNKKPELTVYSGTLSSKDFNLGKFLDQESIVGTVTMNGSVEGQGMTQKSVRAKYKIDVGAINIKGYTYKNVRSEGTVDTNVFVGQAYVKDDNIDLDFNGTIKLDKKEPLFDFNADIRYANLQALKLDTARTIIKAKINSDFAGNSLDHLNGVIQITSAYIETKGELYNIEHLVLQARSSNRQYKELTLESDIANGSIKGNYNFKDLPASFEQFANQLLPDIFKSKPGTTQESFYYEVYIKDAGLIASFLMPDVNAKELNIRGHYKSKESLSLEGEVKEFHYKDFKAYDIKLNGSKNADGPLDFKLSSATVTREDSLLVNKTQLHSQIEKNEIKYQLVLNDSSQKSYAYINGTAFFENGKVSLKTQGSSFAFQELFWRFNDDNEVVIHDSAHIDVRNLRLFGSGDQSLIVNGVISDDAHDIVNIDSVKLDLQILNTILPKTLKLGGKINGHASIKQMLENPVLEADLLLSTVSVNKDTLGDLQVVSKNTGNLLEYELNAKLLTGPLKGMTMSGTVNSNSAKSNNFDIDIHMPESDIAILENFLQDYVEGLSGRASAELKLAGTFDEPFLIGSATLNNIALTEKYLRARVHFSNTISFTKNEIRLNDFYLYDEKNQKGTFGGLISHKSFKDFRVDLYLKRMDNFHILNTTVRDNPDYYGSAYVSGAVTIKGPINQIAISVNAASEANTKIVIPLASGNEAGQYSFISFEKVNDSLPEIFRKNIRDVLDLTLDLNLSVTREAEIQLVFDPTLGDKITARGNGNIRIYMNSFGEFKLYGNYTIEQGDYLFTALNVFQKPFSIDRGSTITWDGDPLNARINVKAIYALRARPYDLAVGSVPETELEQLKSPVPVECELYLRGMLMQPEISFGINMSDFSNTTSSTTKSSLQTVIQQVENDQEELSRQVFALLLFRSFLTPQFAQFSGGTAVSAGDAYNSTIDDLVSAQVNNWLSGIGQRRKLQLGVDLQRNTTTDEQAVILTVNQRFFNDRLILDVAIDPNTYDANSEAQYLITKDGRLRARAFYKNTTNPYFNNNINTSGVGIFYRKEFETFLPNRKRNRPVDTVSRKSIVVPFPQPTDSTKNDSIKVIP